MERMKVLGWQHQARLYSFTEIAYEYGRHFTMWNQLKGYSLFVGKKQ
jgi:hypothetical protein